MVVQVWKKIPQDFFHLVVQVWIRNGKGEYLISQRSADRPSFPLMWECVGGSALIGEDSLKAALRETKEEIGLDLPPDKGILVHSFVRHIYADIVDVWLFEYDGPVSLEQATTKEVAQTAWMTKEQIKELFDTGKLVHTLGYFFTTEGL